MMPIAHSELAIKIADCIENMRWLRGKYEELTRDEQREVSKEVGRIRDKIRTCEAMNEVRRNGQG